MSIPVDSSIAVAKAAIGQTVTIEVFGVPCTGMLVSVTDAGWCVVDRPGGSRFAFWLTAEHHRAALRSAQKARGGSGLTEGLKG